MTQSRRTFLIFLAAISCPVTQALAQETEKESGDPLSVELTGIALPMTSNGVLVNYLFCAIQMQTADASSAFFLRENAHLLRDAIVRIASRSPLATGPTPRSFDRVAVTRIVMQAVGAVRPNTRLVRVTVLEPAFMRH